MSDASTPTTPLTRHQRRALARRARKQGAMSSKLAPAGAALVLGALAAGAPAEAATFTVSNLNDAGAGSLRQAILDANGASGPDVVDFQAGLTGTITLTTGQLDITDSVDIQGPGEAVLTVSGNSASRVFYLYNNAATLDVSISGLTITGGSADNGGGIVDFDENLTLDHVTLQGNTASDVEGGDGAGLWAAGGTMSLSLTHCTLSGNTASDDGGGAYVGNVATPMLIQDTVFSGNQAGRLGGAISFYLPQETMTVERSTFSGNHAASEGGGIALFDPDGSTLILRESTISGNDAPLGGGVRLNGPYTTLLLENDTVSGNQATAGSGGGLSLVNSYAGISIRNTTIACNSATGSGGGIDLKGGRAALDDTIVGDDTGASDPDLTGSGMFDVSFSLVENPGAASLNDNGGNLFNQDPQLGALGNHGGPTQVQVPAGTSPAVNAGDPSFSPPPTTDQRGAGFPRVVGGRLDMGAVELNPGTIQLAVSTASVAESGGMVTVTVTRTGGSDGAVSVQYTTVDGTATAPADYLTAAGTLNWADGDTAPKSFQVTIVDDLLVEGDETFSVVLSAPTGGAALGATATETVTIVDDDVNPVAVVPTLGEAGEVLLAGLLGTAGLLALRRRGSS